MRWAWWAAGALLVAYACSGFYAVGPGELAVVQRWGRLARTERPGLHYRLPAPIDRVQKIDVAGIHKVRIGLTRMPERGGVTPPGREKRQSQLRPGLEDY